MKNLVLSFLVLLAGCGRAGTWPAYVKIDKSTNAFVSNFVIQYTLELNEQLKSEALQFTPPDTDKIQAFPIIVRYSETESEIGAAGTAEKDGYSCIVTIYPVALRSDILKTVLWHEYGHCLGLDHTNANSEIMSAGVFQFRYYKKAAVDRFLNEFKMLLRMVSR
jgi:hypothetical protein